MFIASVMTAFSRATNKIMTSPADYQTACAWEATGMPLSVALRGIETKLARAAGKPWTRNGRAKLEYFTDDVLEIFADWKRAVGPS